MTEKSDAKIIEGFIRDLQAKGSSPGTVKTYTRIIQEFSEWLKRNGGDLSQLTRIDVQQYIHYLEKKGNGSATIQNKFAALSVLARYLGASDILQHIRRPEIRKTRHIAPKSLDRNERNRVLREVERTGNRRDIAIVYLFVYSGLRVSELVNLNREDVVIRERSGSLTVRKGKGNVARTVPLPVE
ncbi:tyrosine-type recombinase/integrase, partial [Kroppenstedtia guangzhouensis]|uniref:tyrosine-type recombinase/integrase n=1 Tax=Kroppenstedtia guangzhouensis TaxID=1274356 RepID=UPI001664E35B